MVLSLPWDLRALCARRADVLSAVARALWRSLRAELAMAAFGHGVAWVGDAPAIDAAVAPGPAAA